MNHYQNQKKKVRAFTLIELLVVITIIGVLVSIAVPATTTVLENVKKVEAAQVLSQFQNALTLYQTDYNTWPEFLTNSINGDGDIEIGSVNNTESDLRDLYMVLSTNESYVVGGATNNRRGTSYLQFTKAAYFAKSETGTGRYMGGGSRDNFVTIIDPWQHPYSLVLDGDYDSQVHVPDVSQKQQGETTTISASIAGWAMGKDTNNPKKYVTTWK